MDRGISVLSERELVVYAERAAIAVLCEMVSDKARAVGRDFLDEVPAGGRAVDGRPQDECGGRVVDAAAAAENEAEKALQLVFASLRRRRPKPSAASRPVGRRQLQRSCSIVDRAPRP